MYRTTVFKVIMTHYLVDIVIQYNIAIFFAVIRDTQNALYTFNTL